MRYIFIASASIFFIYFIVSILTMSEQQEFELIGEQFSSATLSKEANNALTNAEKIRNESIDNFKFWDNIKSYTASFSLFATSIATLLAGLMRIGKTSNEEEFLNTKITSIGLITALASVSTIAYDHTEELASTAKHNSIEISKIIRETTESLKVEPEEESIIISELQAALRIYKK